MSVLLVDLPSIMLAPVIGDSLCWLSFWQAASGYCLYKQMYTFFVCFTGILFLLPILL